MSIYSILIDPRVIIFLHLLTQEERILHFFSSLSSVPSRRREPANAIFPIGIAVQLVEL